MKTLALAPHHLFQYRGNNYLFDVESSAVVRLNDPAYDALSLRLSQPSPKAIANHLAATYGQETAQTVLREQRWLEKRGLLGGPITTYDDAENKVYFQKLTRLGTDHRLFLPFVSRNP